KGKNLVFRKTNQISECAALRVDLFQSQRCFHSRRGCRRTEVVLVVERAVDARNDPERKPLELVVLSSSYGDQLAFRYAVGAHHVFGALGANHCGASLESDVRHIKYVIVVSVSYENEVCPLNARVDCRNVRRRYVGPLVDPTCVSRDGLPDNPPGG